MSIDLFILGVGLIVFLNPINAYSSKLIQRFNDRIGAGNYTYYHLNDQGTCTYAHYAYLTTWVLVKNAF